MRRGPCPTSLAVAASGAEKPGKAVGFHRLYTLCEELRESLILTTVIRVGKIGAAQAPNVKTPDGGGRIYPPVCRAPGSPLDAAKPARRRSTGALRNGGHRVTSGQSAGKRTFPTGKFLR